MTSVKDNYPVVNIPCKNLKKGMLSGSEPTCRSMQAYKMPTPNPKIFRFKCVQCGSTFSPGMLGSSVD